MFVNEEFCLDYGSSFGSFGDIPTQIWASCPLPRSGVSQGLIMRPLLFIIAENADITMFSDDDTSASSSIKRVSDVEYKLLPDMIKICDWLKTNKLSLNTLTGDNWNKPKCT